MHPAKKHGADGPGSPLPLCLADGRRGLIRPPAAGDLPALRRIYLQARCAAFDWMDRSAFAPEDFERDTRGERVWVAALEETAIGFASAWESERFIHHLYVHPDHQGQGAGGALLDACLDGLGRTAALKCLARNQPAVDFYLDRGWYAVARDESPEGPYLLMHYAENPPTHRAEAARPPGRP